jgi:hypothetical protein
MFPERSRCDLPCFFVSGLVSVVAASGCGQPASPTVSEEGATMDLLAAIPTGTVSRDDYVRTPAGFVHRSCVHTVAVGEVVDVDGDILLADGSRKTIARCTRPLLRDLEPGDDDKGGPTGGDQPDIQFVRFSAALVDHALRTSLEAELSYVADGPDGRWAARAGYLYPSDPPSYYRSEAIAVVDPADRLSFAVDDLSGTSSCRPDGACKRVVSVAVAGAQTVAIGAYLDAPVLWTWGGVMDRSGVDACDALTRTASYGSRIGYHVRRPRRLQTWIRRCAGGPSRLPTRGW